MATPWIGGAEAGLTRTDGWASWRAARGAQAARVVDRRHDARMADEPIGVDRLRRAAPAEVVLLDGFRVGEGPIREPHRHGYHELILVRDGRGEQAIDDVTARCGPAR